MPKVTEETAEAVAPDDVNCIPFWVSHPLVDSRPGYAYKWHKSAPRRPWSLVLTFAVRSEMRS